MFSAIPTMWVPRSARFGGCGNGTARESRALCRRFIYLACVETRDHPEHAPRKGSGPTFRFGHENQNFNQSAVPAPNLFLFRTKVLPIGVGHYLIKVAELARAAQPFAAVHHNGFSIDVAAAVANQECCEIGKFLRCAKTVQWNALKGKLLKVLARQEPGERALGWNRTRSNGIQPNTARAPL